MSHKKAGGSTKLGRDSQSQRLGLKLSGGQFAKAGAIILRQRGTKFWAGDNVMRTHDDSLMALTPGIVKFTNKSKVRFDGSRHVVKCANVESVIAASK